MKMRNRLSEPEGKTKIRKQSPLYAQDRCTYEITESWNWAQRTSVLHVYSPDVCIELKAEEGTCLHSPKVVATGKYKSWFPKDIKEEIINNLW